MSNQSNNQINNVNNQNNGADMNNEQMPTLKNGVSIFQNLSVDAFKSLLADSKMIEAVEEEVSTNQVEQPRTKKVISAPVKKTPSVQKEQTMKAKPIIKKATTPAPQVNNQPQETTMNTQNNANNLSAFMNLLATSKPNANTNQEDENYFPDLEEIEEEVVAPVQQPTTKTSIIADALNQTQPTKTINNQPSTNKLETKESIMSFIQTAMQSKDSTPEVSPTTVQETEAPVSILASIMSTPKEQPTTKTMPTLSTAAALWFPVKADSSFYQANPDKLANAIEAANVKATKLEALLGNLMIPQTIYIAPGASSTGMGEFRALWTLLATAGKLEGAVYKDDIKQYVAKATKVCGIEVPAAKVDESGKSYVAGVNYAANDSDIAKIWGNHIFTILANLSNDQIMEFVGILCSNTKVKDGNLYIFWAGESVQHIINFESLTWENGRQERRANANAKIAKTLYPVKVVLAVMAIKAARSSAKETNVMLVETPNVWNREENYGDVYGELDLTKVVLDNLSLPLTFAPIEKGFPFVCVGNARIDANDLAETLEDGVLAAPDKYNMQWLTTGVGAEAMFIGQNEAGDIVSIHDMSKIGKVYNRPPQATKYLRAIIADRQASKLGVQLSDGRIAFGGGKYLRTAITNSRFGHGSGVAVTNPNLEFDYAVDKTVRQTIHALRLPAATRNAISKIAAKQQMTFAQALTSKLESKLDEIMGQTFAPGQVVFSLCEGRYTVVTNSTKAEWWIVQGYRLLDTNANEENADSIELVLNVRMSATDKCVKLRGLGKKLTTLPYKVYGMSENVDIILNNETLKGFVAHIEAYAIAKGGAIYMPATACLHMVDGTVVDLKQSENAFTAWLQANAKVETISFNMAKSEFDALYAIKASVFDATDMTWEVINESTVCIKETVEVVYCDLPYDIEVSTPRESISSSKMTLEQVAALRMQDAALGDAIGSELSKQSAKVKALISQFKVPVGTIPTIDVDTLSGRQKVRSIIGDLKKGYDKNDSAVMAKLEKAYAKGVVLQVTLQARKESLFIVPSALMAFGGMIGGTASGWMLQLYTLLAEITDEAGDTLPNRDTKVRAWLTKVNSRLNAWVKTMCKSEKIMKKITRAGEVINGKVKTSYHPALHSNDGIPVVMLHPNCPMVSMLGVKDGDLVGIQRTPMPFVTVCRAKLHWHGQIAHATITPLVWHSANEGDSDGRPA